MGCRISTSDSSMRLLVIIQRKLIERPGRDGGGGNRFSLTDTSPSRFSGTTTER